MSQYANEGFIMSKIVIIKKYTPSSFLWWNLTLKKKVELPLEVVLRKYEGFEGEPIAFLTDEQTNDILGVESDLLVLRVGSSEDIGPPHLDPKAFLMGYEFGICEEDKTLYSSIFNEILFGQIEELVSYKTELNNHFLFPTKDLAEQYAVLHRDLCLKGKDVEGDQEMTVYKIWKYNTSTHVQSS